MGSPILLTSWYQMETIYVSTVGLQWNLASQILMGTMWVGQSVGWAIEQYLNCSSCLQHCQYGGPIHIYKVLTALTIQKNIDITIEASVLS
jgi:hypothetical protein